jgi:chromate transporter
MLQNLIDLAVMCGHLGLLAVGGINSVVPEMQRETVEVHRWMSAQEFASLYALAQAAPGPNMLVATLVGWRVAGVAGALVATVSLTAPPCLLVYFVSRFWHRFRKARWRGVIQSGLTAVTAGLVTAASVLLAETTSNNWQTALITILVAGVLLRSRVNPLVLLGTAAAVGATGALG